MPLTLPDDLKPSVDDVALLLRERTPGDTMGGLGGDTNTALPTTFDESTRPTAAEAQRVIDTAYGVTVSKFEGGAAAVPDDPDIVTSVKFAVSLYAAVLIAISFFGADDSEGIIQLWRELYRDNVKSARDVIAPGFDESFSFGTLRITSSVERPAPNYDPVPGIDF
jgi:hypothetical protein